MKRLAPAVTLMLIAPIIGEFLLGNLPLSSPASLAAYPVLMLLYGSGAVLIREVARRLGRGYPTIGLLALGYGILEEGVVTQSLFNSDFQGLDLHAYGGVAALGMGLPWTLFVLTIHSVWSIVVPIMLVEFLFWDRRHGRWLNTAAVVALVILYLVGFAALCFGTIFAESFVASPAQLVGAVVVAAVVVILALVGSRGAAAARSERRVWPPVALGGLILLCGSVFFLAYQLGSTERLFPAPVAVAGLLVALGTAGVVLRDQSRRGDWTDRHRYAVLAGALLTYCWVGFLVQISQYGLHLVSAIVQIVIVAGILVLLRLAGRHRGGGYPMPSNSPPPPSSSLL